MKNSSSSGQLARFSRLRTRARAASATASSANASAAHDAYTCGGHTAHHNMRMNHRGPPHDTTVYSRGSPEYGNDTFGEAASALRLHVAVVRVKGINNTVILSMITFEGLADGTSVSRASQLVRIPHRSIRVVIAMATACIEGALVHGMAILLSHSSTRVAMAIRRVLSAATLVYIWITRGGGASVP